MPPPSHCRCTRTPLSTHPNQPISGVPAFPVQFPSLPSSIPQPGREVRSPAIAFPDSTRTQTATKHQSIHPTAPNAGEKKKNARREGVGRRESPGRRTDAAGRTDACGPPQPPTPAAVPAGCRTVTQGSRRLHKPQRRAQPRGETTAPKLRCGMGPTARARLPQGSPVGPAGGTSHSRSRP